MNVPNWCETDPLLLRGGNGGALGSGLNSIISLSAFSFTLALSPFKFQQRSAVLVELPKGVADEIIVWAWQGVAIILFFCFLLLIKINANSAVS